MKNRRSLFLIPLVEDVLQFLKMARLLCTC